MVLTDDEKSALTELLSGVEAEDLMQIAKTVSQKLLNIKSVNGKYHYCGWFLFLLRGFGKSPSKYG